MSARLSSILAALSSLLLAGSISAQSRDEGWEFGGNLIYQDSQDLTFEGGSTASFDDDIGLGIAVTYRFNGRLEVEFGLDWSSVDYDANVAPASSTTAGFSSRGEIETITPRVNANFNFIEGPLTPYVSAGVGYSFIDTNIPDAPPQIGCWWDPWYGQVCSTFQSTRTIEEFAYQAGVGLRWDLSSSHVLRFGYEKRWIDVGSANGTPNFDQLKLGFTFKY